DFVFIFVTMKSILFTLSTFICTTVSFAQTATKTHTVAKGDTIPQTAKKYNTTNNVLLLLNPETVEGVSKNQDIKIPITAAVPTQVQPKETVYGNSKQYNNATKKLYDLNPGIKKNRLKIGHFLNFSQTDLSNSKQQSTIGTSTVIVEKGETIYG